GARVAGGGAPLHRPRALAAVDRGGAPRRWLSLGNEPRSAPATGSSDVTPTSLLGAASKASGWLGRPPASGGARGDVVAHEVGDAVGAVAGERHHRVGLVAKADEESVGC